jgi:hypothetical protein
MKALLDGIHQIYRIVQEVINPCVAEFLIGILRFNPSGGRGCDMQVVNGYRSILSRSGSAGHGPKSEIYNSENSHGALQ